MSEKHLTELPWKTLASKQKLKDPGLAKALAELAKCDEKDPERKLKALAAVEKQAEALEKEHKKNEEVKDYLTEIFKEADKQRKALELLKKGAGATAGEAEGEEEKEEGVDLKAKLVTWMKKVKQRKPDDPPVEVMVCKAGAAFGVLLAKKVGSSQKSQLQELFKGETGLKFVKGTCELRPMEVYTFVLETLPSGAGKGLRAFLKEQTQITYKLKACDPSGAMEEELEEVGAGTAPAAPPPKPAAEEKPPEAPQPAPPDLMAVFTKRFQDLMPRIKQALAAAGPAVNEIKTKAADAGAAAKKRDFEQANRLLDATEALLKGPAGTTPPKPPPPPKPVEQKPPAAPPKPAGSPKLSTYMNATRDWKAAKKTAADGVFALKNAIFKECDKELEAAVKAKIDSLNGILTAMDDGIITKIEDAGREADAERQTERNNELAKFANHLLAALRKHPLASVADVNPFGSFTIRGPLETVLTKIAADFSA